MAEKPICSSYHNSWILTLSNPELSAFQAITGIPCENWFEGIYKEMEVASETNIATRKNIIKKDWPRYPASWRKYWEEAVERPYLSWNHQYCLPLIWCIIKRVGGQNMLYLLTFHRRWSRWWLNFHWPLGHTVGPARLNMVMRMMIIWWWHDDDMMILWWWMIQSDWWYRTNARSNDDNLRAAAKPSQSRWNSQSRFGCPDWSPEIGRIFVRFFSNVSLLLSSRLS